MESSADEIVLAVIGDVHGELYHLKKVLDHLARIPIAGVLLVGDFGSPAYEISRWQKRSSSAVLRQEMDRILGLVRQLEVPVVWVPGDHDLPELFLPGNCDRRLLSVAGIRVYGIGGAGPSRAGFPYEWSDDEVRALEVPQCDVILSHVPPAATDLDKLFHAEQHVGSVAIREIAERHVGALVCGHIHEASGVLRLSDCLCMNVGSLGDPYGLMQVGFVVFSKTHNALIEVVHENLLTGRQTSLTR